jgi:hypothetical protein
MEPNSRLRRWLARLGLVVVVVLGVGAILFFFGIAFIVLRGLG